ncbi:HGL052Wp [Eremothecium sinecaudum]|uniref:HGL052Wp n=1 Tax=Eremothecium sinecaudum TaxID=45286 RepID=A0A109V0B1_9SACH|nr:HGL052Wp [Eremothecium sinecaudum]AMD22288.1 HGL052Wp [Eremothecium sinecaudum]
MFIGFYITDSQRNLVFQFLLSSQAPTFKQINNKLVNVESLADNIIPITKDTSLYKYIATSRNLFYWALCKSEQNPLAPLVFLVNYDETLMTYFDKDTLTIPKLVNNYDRLTLLLHSMLDSGEVVETDCNRLRQLIPIRQDFSTVINSTTKTIASSIKNAEPNQLFGASKRMAGQSQIVPWRSANVQHTTNEIYVDVIETINLVLTRTSATPTVNSASISGKIDIKCYLSGNPTIQLNLTTAGHEISSPAFHRCIDPSGSNFDPSCLRFIPPDGKFTLAQYEIDLDSMPHNSKKLANIGLVSVSLLTKLGARKDEFEIKCNIANSTHVTSVDNLRVTVFFPPLPAESKIRVLRNTHGGWENNLSNTQGIWIFDKTTPVGSIPVLRGCVEHNDNHLPNFPTHVAVSYTNRGQLPSGLRVNSINIPSGLPQGVKPFKGVKYMTRTGNYVLRA